MSSPQSQPLRADGLPATQPTASGRRLAPELEAVCGQAREQARALMTGGRLYCAPAVLFALNQRLGGGLSEDMIRRLTAGLPEGMGSGCACGALSGAQLALGLFLGERGYGGAMTRAARALHDHFKAQAGSTCCRALTRKAKGHGQGGEHCADLTGLATELACRQVLAARPELACAGQEAPALPHRSWWRRLRRG